MALVRLIKMCTIGTYSTAWVDKYLSDFVPIKNGLKQGDFYCLCFRVCQWEGSGKPGWPAIKWYTTAFGLC
jgi:hypothetical protein